MTEKTTTDPARSRSTPARSLIRDRGPASADLPEHYLRVPRRRSRGRFVQPARGGIHLFPPDQPDGLSSRNVSTPARAASAASPTSSGTRRRSGALPAGASGRQHHRLDADSMAARSRSSARPSNASAGRSRSSISTICSPSRTSPTIIPARSSARASRTPAATLPTSRPSPRSRNASACRCPSTPPRPRRNSGKPSRWACRCHRALRERPVSSGMARLGGIVVDSGSFDLVGVGQISFDDWA